MQIARGCVHAIYLKQSVVFKSNTMRSQLSRIQIIIDTFNQI